MAHFLLTNSTDIRNADIKRFVSKCLNNELEQDTLIVGLSYNDDRAVKEVWGFAFQGVRTLSVILPTTWKGKPGEVRDLAQVMLHELGHTYGLDEHEIPSLARLDTRWCEGLQLRRRKGGSK